MQVWVRVPLRGGEVIWRNIYESNSGMLTKRHQTIGRAGRTSIRMQYEILLNARVWTAFAEGSFNQTKEQGMVAKRP